MQSIIRTSSRCELEPTIRLPPIFGSFDPKSHYKVLKEYCHDDEMLMIKEEWVDFFWSVSAWVRWRFGIN
mgnify:CR=1 FL=1